MFIMEGGAPPIIQLLQELLGSPSWPVVAAAMQAGVDRANTRAVSNVANIKKWSVLPR